MHWLIWVYIVTKTIWWMKWINKIKISWIVWRNNATISLRIACTIFKKLLAWRHRRWYTCISDTQQMIFMQERGHSKTTLTTRIVRKLSIVTLWWFHNLDNSNSWLDVYSNCDPMGFSIAPKIENILISSWCKYSRKPLDKMRKYFVNVVSEWPILKRFQALKCAVAGKCLWSHSRKVIFAMLTHREFSRRKVIVVYEGQSVFVSFGAFFTTVKLLFCSFRLT